MPEPRTKIPKFASFRPKPDAPVSAQVEGQTSSTAKREPRGLEEKKVDHGHHRSQGKERHPRHSSASKERHKKLEQLGPGTDEPLESFIIDRNGDIKNLVYGSLHRYSVPPFHRAGAGGVLGVLPDMKIDRDYEEEKGIVLSNRRDFKSNFRGNYIFSKIERQRPRLLRIRPELKVEKSMVHEMDYVPLQNSMGKKREREDAGASSGSGSGSDNERTNYRSIHGKAKPNDQPMDNNFQYATESESSGSEDGRIMKLDASVRQKTVELSRKVEQFPHDITAWLALIEHQDTLIRAEGEKHRISSAEISSTADIKIHMYEKALQQARSLEDRETLLLGLMTEGAKIWEVKTQSDRWEQISKENIDSIVLWKSYLNFKQTTFGIFRYEEVRDIFVDRIKRLLEASRAGNLYALYHQLIYVLLRFTIFIRESGYSELAIAIWQGLLEFNFFVPPASTQPRDKITLFGEFWESEVSRIGEDGALGWRYFAENQDASEPPKALVDTEENLLDNMNVFKSWAKAERTRSQMSRLPARTMDEVIEDDPFRTILFSDIESFLVSFPSQSNDLRKALLDAFLLFCRLPQMSSSDKTARSWASDPFVGGVLLECNTGWINRKYLPKTSDLEGAQDVDTSSVLTSLSTNFSSSPDSMFGTLWFKNLWKWGDLYAGDNGPVGYVWIRNAFKQLLQAYFLEDLAEYCLAFEWVNEPETIKKVSKGLLKQHPSSLRLYNAYAVIEWSRGNKKVAEGVFSAALNMSKSMPENDQEASILLWKSWIWSCLEELDNISALNRIMSIESGTPKDDILVSPFVLLKTKQHLTLYRDYNLYSGNLSYAILYAECLALLEYLSSKSVNDTQSSSQGHIAAALSVYTSFSQTLTQSIKDRKVSDTSSHELLLQSACRLLYHHSRTGPFRPALLREYLAKYLTLFPQNTIFLSLYTYNESRLRIDNRVRSILLSTILTPSNDTMTSRLFAIYYELSYGTIHSVRSAFEHAVSSPSCKSSPGLWRFYVIYCLQTPEFLAQVNEVWYRALRACPWAKELYILGFERMSSLSKFAELKDTWRVMGEKELRVHVDLEDMFDEVHEMERYRKGGGRLN